MDSSPADEPPEDAARWMLPSGTHGAGDPMLAHRELNYE